RLFESRELGAWSRGLEDTAMEQAWQHEIVHKARPAEHLVGDVKPGGGCAGNAPRAGRLWDGAGNGIALQQRIVGELPIAGAQVAGADDGAVLDRQRLRGDA